MEQQGLNIDFEKYQLKPDDSISEPFIWIKELRFYGDGFSDLRRTIKLRRGMNILWSTSTVDTENKGSVHAAGKSLFCRMIRYILGEPTFANEVVTQEIRDRYINGVVAAEIGLNGETWTIVRPVHGTTRNHWAYRKTTFDMLLDNATTEATPYKDFLEQLNQLFMQKYPLQKFPDTQEAISWDYVYPFFTRDQDCHFKHPLDWRDTSSESEAKSPPKEKNSYIVRGFIGDISTQEQELIQEDQKLSAKVKQLKTDIPSRKYHSQALRDYLQKLNPEPELATFDNALFFDTAARRLDAAIEQKQSERDAIRPQPENNAALANLTTAKAEEAKIQAEHDKQLGELKIVRLRLKSLKQTLTETEQQTLSFADKLKPAPSFRCNTPIRIAIEKGCPCHTAHKTKQSEQWETEKSKKEQEIAAYQKLIPEYEANLAQLQDQLSESQRKVAAAMQEYSRSQSIMYQQISRLNQELLELKRIHASAQQGKEAFEQMEQMEDDFKSQSNILDGLKDDIRDVRRRLNQKAKLQAAFTDILQYIVNDEFQGKISFDRNSMQLKACHKDKTEDSTAYKTINTVALDYALMLLGIDGSIHHPLFLMHDSPKDSDMGDSIYHSFFEYMKAVEDAFGASEPSFQYIITTTASPPEKFQVMPWLIDPILDAAIPEKRLLGVDL